MDNAPRESWFWSNPSTGSDATRTLNRPHEGLFYATDRPALSKGNAATEFVFQSA